VLNDILSPCGGSFPAGSSTELRAQLNKTRNVTLTAGSPTTNSRSEISGVSARCYKNGVYGFSSTAELSVAAARGVVKAAAENAAFMDRHIKKGRPGLPPLRMANMNYFKEYRDPEQAVYLDFLRELDCIIVDKYKNLSSRRLAIRADSMEKLLLTSDGVSAHSILPRCYVYVVLSAETKDGMPIEMYKIFGGLGSFEDSFSEPKLLIEGIDDYYNKLMDKREGVYAEAGLKTCILDGALAGMLAHEAVGHTVEADIVLGGSVAASCLNRQVASEKVSLTDFAHTALGSAAPLPVYVDDEGTTAVDAELIKDGILTGYMNSRETAQRFDMEPQGNARAYSFSDEPLIRMRNTAILPGKDRLEDMIASIDDGYYLLESNNGQADTTGEFMFGINMGYEIKKGRLGKAILDTTISGLAFDMLKTVDMVSGNMTWVSAGFCGKKQPMPVGLGGPELRCKVTVGGR
jgi:TldD protein